jgi:hypothetical protein
MSTGEVTKAMRVACARQNQYRKAKDRVSELVPEKLEKFYDNLDGETPMFSMSWNFPDPDTGKVKKGELVFNILSPDSIKKMAPLIERMHGPRPRKKAGDGNSPPKEAKPKKEEQKKEEEPKEAPKKETPKKPPADSKEVDDGLFDDD